MRRCTMANARNTFSATDEQALEAAVRLSRTEGIIPGLETAHAVAEAIRRAPDHKAQDLPRQPVRTRR